MARKAEGDIDCPGSYDYDVLFRVVPGFSFAMAQCPGWKEFGRSMRETPQGRVETT